MLQNDLQKSVFEAILTRCERFRMRRVPENQPNAQIPVQPYGRTGLTVEKTRRAREGRSPFELSIVPSGMYGGHGAIFAPENPIFQSKNRFLAAFAPGNLRDFSKNW